MGEPNYPQKFLDLVSIFNAHPESHDKLYSNSEFRDDVRCRCGWALSLNSKNCYKVLHDTKKHFEKRSSPLTSSKTYRRFDEKHLLYGFYLKNDNIIKISKPPSARNWTLQRENFSATQSTFTPKPSPVANFLAGVQRDREELSALTCASVEKCLEGTRKNSSDLTSKTRASVDHSLEESNKRSHDLASEAKAIVEHRLKEKEKECVLPDSTPLLSHVAAECQRKKNETEELIQTILSSLATESEDLRNVVNETTDYIQDTRENCSLLRSQAIAEGIAEVEEIFSRERETASDNSESGDPFWMAKLKSALSEGVIDDLQTEFLKCFSSGFLSPPTGRHYSELSKTIYKFIQLATSSQDYEILRRLLNGPTGRTLRDFRYHVLTDIGPSIRNMQECEAFFSLVSVSKCTRLKHCAA